MNHDPFRYALILEFSRLFAVMTTVLVAAKAIETAKANVSPSTGSAVSNFEDLIIIYITPWCFNIPREQSWLYILSRDFDWLLSGISNLLFGVIKIKPVAAQLGFEPRFYAPEAHVLPLDDRAIVV